jgi:hypothetical protein
VKPKRITKCIIDADIIAYRSAAGTKGESPRDTEDKIDVLMNYIVGETVVFPTPDNLECFLTGGDNFRHEVAKTAPYKGNRKDVPKPSNLPEARAWLQSKWGSIVSQGEEADDLIGIAATKGDPETTVVCTIDKDMLQIPCWHFNFVKNTWTKVSEAEGSLFFYTQILTGDAADNIKGIFRVGPVKAGKILDGLTTEEELYKACVDAYANSEYARVNVIDLGDESSVAIPWATDRVLENARLLWLRRYEGETWEPPR